MLSVVAGEPLPAAEVLPHIEAASAHWQRGDKALANLRLIFAKLPRPGDPAAVERLALTERLLDDGLAPGDLMKALWPQPAADALRRYDPAQPRVPAGHGADGGRWEVAGGDSEGTVSFEDRRIVVAANPGGVKGESPEEEKLFDLRDKLGEATPEEEVAHGRPINPFGGMPMGLGPGPFARQSIPAGPTPRPAPMQQRELNRFLREDGCHTCGIKESGTPNGNAVGYHQPPTALVPQGTPQRYFPQCWRCSRVQGGRVRAFKAYREKSPK